MCVCTCIRLCILDREGNRVFASRAQAVVQMVVYLTGFTFNDCLAGFHEPPLPPYSYRCHASLKKILA